ncbi:uncharacterized protein LOC131674302 isoform X2 [Phymastichus coffea]|uniref:uncharacterized protein LOC131674302 isoform X2 n=1 Tax=Phymastichus coffea TaxID=108790 RepID=UPI00273BF5A9|nr:uncharacterized protein LOC131674302 isoform X2 [Phymastichus coffea]
MPLLVSLTLALLLAGAVDADESPVLPTTTPASTTGGNNQTMSAMPMPEAKRAPEPPMWAPSPPDLTPMMMHQQAPMAAQPVTAAAAPIHHPIVPQAIYPAAAAVAHSPPQQPVPQSQSQQQQQPFVPANYYLPADEYPAHQYGAANEYRSEHYSSYPPFEPQQPSYPIQAQQQQSLQQLDTSLIPTAKHFVLVSFIGLLLLFAIIQNSIAAAKRKDALVEVLSNRKKRDIVALTSLHRMRDKRVTIKPLVLADSGDGIGAERGRSGALHTKDPLLRESQASGRSRHRRQTARQVFNA